MSKTLSLSVKLDVVASQKLSEELGTAHARIPGEFAMSLTVFAVDDSRTMRDMLKITLVGAGFEIHLAEDGVHGLEVLDTITPDVIITDINMPRLDGFGFIDAVRAREDAGGTPILVLTTESSTDLKQRARSAGATGWIVKPFDPEKLVKAINMVAG
jgi:two-component system chemotaxis response regulator CheY